MYDDYDGGPEIIGRASGYAIWFWALGIALIIGTTFVFAWLRPAFLGFERKASVESHQYVETQKTQLLTFMEKHDELSAEILKYEASGHDGIAKGLKAQQRSLERRIRAAMAKIPRDEWPHGAERFEK